MEVAKILAAVIGLAFGIILFRKVWKQSKLIDTESIAVVKSVQDLGVSEMGKVYAIQYDVCASEMFEIFETPCKKKRKIGLQRTIFYEKANPKTNYYFKTIGQIDKRFGVPVFLIAASVIVLISIFIRLIF